MRSLLLALSLCGGVTLGQVQSGPSIYHALQEFDLNGGMGTARDLTLVRDRLEISFNGSFYFEAPVAGRVRGAVFLGQGRIRAEPPPLEFERANVRRLLKADFVESSFETAVLRFSDDTFDRIGGNLSPHATAPKRAIELARRFQARVLRETGANIAARVATSILNQERPGFFVVEVDQGKRGRFVAVLDQQGRIPSSVFAINGGEKGLIFTNRGPAEGNDVWMTFYSLKDFERGVVEYSDAFDLIDVEHYSLDIDVREPKKKLRLDAVIRFRSLTDQLRAIPFSLCESLPERNSLRLKKAMRLLGASGQAGVELEAIQEDWEGGLTVYLTKPLSRGEKLSVRLQLEGDYMFDSPYIPDCFYPLSNSDWYPRHGYLDRSTVHLKFRHRRKHKVAASGVLVSEEPVPEDKSQTITVWEMEDPVPLVTFGVGQYERHSLEVTAESTPRVPVEFYSLPGRIAAIKEDFMLAEMANSLNYFSDLFGEYPYRKFGAVYHPRGFGQGFASLLLLPNADSASKHTYAFLAHETAHQWWGNMVAWRSYRDQWLSEGFAEYSGIIYTRLRANPKASHELIQRLRRSLREPPRTETGVAEGRLAEVGPLILGHRLETRRTRGSYQALIYAKGALVLRMLHFLFTDPVSGEGNPFFDLMGEFVEKYANQAATTEGFLEVANQHFKNTPIARKYGLQDLNWFFRQWVYQSHLPSYRVEYRIEKERSGVVLKGEVVQEDAPEDWLMPLPLLLKFKGGKTASGTVLAYGPSHPFELRLPLRPQKVELDPRNWVLSGKTESRKK